MDDFSLNVNKMSQSVQVRSEPIRMDGDEDVYDLRRQIEARQVVRDFVRTEMDRLKALDQQIVQEIIQLDLKLRDRKPAGEPKNKRYLYKPGTEGQYQLRGPEGNSVEGEIVE